jgi:hypothetical protein
MLIGAAGIFSAAVTIDESLRSLAIAPAERARFYDEEWGVDSVVAALPPKTRLLSHTGFGRLSWASDYALLGPSGGRTLVSIDGPYATDSIIAVMRARAILYAYVPTSSDNRAEVMAMYPPERFDLVHSSGPGGPRQAGTRRSLYRLRDPAPP